MVIEEIRNISAQMTSPEVRSLDVQRRSAESLALKNAQPATAEKESSVEVSREELEQTIQALNQAVSLLNHRLKFSIDEVSGRVIAKVIDNQSNEVIREVPPERVMEFVHRFREFLGLLVDEKA